VVKILLVESDPAIAQSIELMLKYSGMTVYTTDLGEEAVDLAQLYDYDVMLLELKLPDLSGFDVIRRLAIAKCKTPILVVSQCKRIEDKVMSLGIGAADHMEKPFHSDELVARILALVRRCNGYADHNIKIGKVELDINLRTVRVSSGRPLDLTRKEYTMLEILMLRAGKTLSKGALLNHLYGGFDEPELKIIDVFVCKLRRKLAEAGAENVIKTVWGRGMTIEPEIPTLRECLSNA
jgi:two-component system, cell cycle response regulator CtrA